MGPLLFITGPVNELEWAHLFLIAGASNKFKWAH